MSIYQQEAGKKNLSDYEKLQNNRKLAYISNGFIYNNDFINGIYLFTQNGDVYSFSKESELEFDENVSGTDWYKNTLAANGKLCLNLVDPYIFFSRSVIDFNSGKTLGEILIVCNYKMLSKVAYNIAAENHISITDEKGKLLYTNESNNKNKFIDKDMLKTLSEGRSGYFYKSNEYYAYNTLSQNDWKIVIKLSMLPFINEFKNNINYTLFILALFLMLSFVISIIFSNMFSKPIINLGRLMVKGDIKTLDIDEDSLARKDEIGILYNQFNKMLCEIRKLIQEKYVNKIMLLNSKIKLLTSQINSHFIFNTLENINSLAEIEGIEKISIMSKSLGDILRYSIDDRSDIVELNDELKHVEDYINIREIGFGREIHLEVDAKPEILKEKVLKFILQPIVENSVSHGFDRSCSVWKLTIDVFLDNGMMNIKICDNGVGMTEEKLSEIKNNLKRCTKIYTPHSKGCHGIGLINVNSRIKLYYGDKYGIDLESEINKGTCTTIVLPGI